MSAHAPDPDHAETAMMCAVCGRILDHVIGQGWAHTVADGADHPAVPVPVGAVPVNGRCDFCFDDHPSHVLHADPITIAGVTHAGDVDPVGGLDGDWACCAVCADLIVANRWNEITRRAVAAMRAHDGDVPEASLTALRSLHRTLRRTMRGLPEPLT